MVVYLISLNRWLSPESLGTLARLAGWGWQPEVGRPLTLVVFAPLKLLPTAWLPCFANLLTAICAAFVLQQLARSVAILRHDISPEGPAKNNKPSLGLLTGSFAWLPPV